MFAASGGLSNGRQHCSALVLHPAHCGGGSQSHFDGLPLLFSLSFRFTKEHVKPRSNISSYKAAFQILEQHFKCFRVKSVKRFAWKCLPSLSALGIRQHFRCPVWLDVHTWPLYHIHVAVSVETIRTYLHVPRTLGLCLF